MHKEINHFPPAADEQEGTLQTEPNWAIPHHPPGQFGDICWVLEAESHAPISPTPTQQLLPLLQLPKGQTLALHAPGLELSPNTRGWSGAQLQLIPPSPCASKAAVLGGMPGPGFTAHGGAVVGNQAPNEPGCSM